MEDLAAAAGATSPPLAWQDVDHRRGCRGDASVNTTTTKTTATADAIWRSRLRSPPGVPCLKGIGERYTPNHLKQHPPPVFPKRHNRPLGRGRRTTTQQPTNKMRRGSGGSSGGGSATAQGRRQLGGGAQRNGGSAVVAARQLRRWRQRKSVTSAAAWRRRGGGGITSARRW